MVSGPAEPVMGSYPQFTGDGSEGTRPRRYGHRVRIEEPATQLARLLGATPHQGSFSVKRTAKAADLQIEVDGVGPLEYPVSAAQAKLMRKVSRQAKYGKGERTLVDRKVRDTWEVPTSLVQMHPQWNKTLEPILVDLRTGLGLPDGCRLEAALHSMLVYEPGQFFVPHQDSEKSDDMVATLVVTLPSASVGGELVVEHGGERISYRSSDKSLSLVAFYADCRHEVRPVTSGYRVSLTYNLMLSGAASDNPVVPDVVVPLTDLLEGHFEAHNRLVYLLDHEYTERGLSWSRLKGADAARVPALRAAAEAGDCEIALALAHVHETRSAYDANWRRSGRWDFEDDIAESDPEELEIGELLDGSTTLAAALDQSGAPVQPGSVLVSDDEVCATTPTTLLHPYASEYEGNMGNYGNTMDRWYQRGAVVVWPRRLDFAVRAQASPDWALDTLAGQLRRGDFESARANAELLAPLWASLARVGMLGGEPVRLGWVDFARALEVANGLEDPVLAAMLLAPFRLEQLSAEDAPALGSLAQRYGIAWVRDLFTTWHGSGPDWHADRNRERTAWIALLPELCSALTSAGAADVAGFLLELCWKWLTRAIGLAKGHNQPSRRAHALDELAAPIAGLLAATAATDASKLSNAFVTFLARDDALLRCVVNALRQVSDVAPALLAHKSVGKLARHVRAQLESALAQPTREPDDWSVPSPGTCKCKLCAQLGEFLTHPARRTLEWRLVEDGRKHIHLQIDQHELPVQHETRRAGRPYTLVLTKSPAPFEREKQTRRADEADLRWLREHIPSAA
jgi:predicted 2-oxoglutarate/Fe(II)-dependent dioxygenase YbiX